MLGAATVMAIYLLWFKKKPIDSREMDLCDNLTYVGLAFMTLGMLSGAVWAKEAWGHYWSWDPKEVWALAAFIIYGISFHRKSLPCFQRPWLFHGYMIFAFAVVLMTYFGVNYLLGGMHSYANS